LGTPTLWENVGVLLVLAFFRMVTFGRGVSGELPQGQMPPKMWFFFIFFLSPEFRKGIRVFPLWLTQFTANVGGFFLFFWGPFFPPFPPHTLSVCLSGVYLSGYLFHFSGVGCVLVFWSFGRWGSGKFCFFFVLAGGWGAFFPVFCFFSPPPTGLSFLHFYAVDPQPGEKSAGPNQNSVFFLGKGFLKVYGVL